MFGNPTAVWLVAGANCPESNEGYVIPETLGGIGTLALPHVGLSGVPPAHPSNPMKAYCSALLVYVSGMAEVGRYAALLNGVVMLVGELQVKLTVLPPWVAPLA
jgi:hypothetical protein